MEFLTFLTHYWWLVSIIAVVLIAIVIMESLESNQTKNAVTCDEGILKVNDAGYVWIDARTRQAYKEGAIIGAKHIEEIKKPKIKSNKKHKYIYYCENGSESLKIAQKETQLYLKGGFDVWKSQSLPTDKRETS